MGYGNMSNMKPGSNLLVWCFWCHSPISLLFQQEFHKFCHSSLMYLLIVGFRLVFEILVFKESDMFIVDIFLAAESTLPFPMIPIWFGIQQKTIFVFKLLILLSSLMMSRFDIFLFFSAVTFSTRTIYTVWVIWEWFPERKEFIKLSQFCWELLS